MKRMPKPYRISDRAIEILSRWILRKTEQTRNRLSILKFDEVNVLKETDALYASIERNCRKVFRELYVDRYTELWRYLKNEDPDEDTIDELVDMYLAGMWDEPNPNTHYAFQPELIRKRDRAKEAIVSVPTRMQKQLELEKGSRYIIQQIGFYSDIVEDAASLQAFKDAGIKRVRWNTYGDDKVCADCHELNGKVFDIDKTPSKPHLRCRCYLSPA